MNLQLSLKTKWFELSEPDQKTEDYRDINKYWAKRLLDFNEEIEDDVFSELVELLSDTNQFDSFGVKGNMAHFNVSFKKFTTNTLTKGYPPKEDMSRKKVYEHKGIEIRKGREEWGAEPGKLYFVIKHGKRL